MKKLVAREYQRAHLCKVCPLGSNNHSDTTSSSQTLQNADQQMTGGLPRTNSLWQGKFTCPGSNNLVQILIQNLRDRILVRSGQQSDAHPPSSCCKNYGVAVIINQLETAQAQRTMSWHRVHIYSVRESNEKRSLTPSRAETPTRDIQKQNESAGSVEDMAGLLQNCCPIVTKMKLTSMLLGSTAHLTVTAPIFAGDKQLGRILNRNRVRDPIKTFHFLKNF